MARNELKFQNHIIDSYKAAGGKARKWASEWQKGPADLVCALPVLGTHLLEVKHRPTFGNRRVCIQNPMDEKQVKEARDYIKAGSMVGLAIVRGEKAINAKLAIYFPLLAELDPWSAQWWGYVPGTKWDMDAIVREYRERFYEHVR